MAVESNTTGSRFLENLAYLVPCSIGYRLRGQRREEDSRLRALLLQRLRAIRGTMNDSLVVPTDAPEPSWAECLDERADKLDRVATAIRHAPYGFSGFFEAEEIAEGTLDQILEVDLLLFEDLDAIQALLTCLEEPMTSGPAFQDFIQSLDDATRRFENHLILRDKLLGNA